MAEAKGWRWTQWTTLFFIITTFSSILFVSESYKMIIIQHRARHNENAPSPTQPRVSSVQAVKRFLAITPLRSLHMLFTEPIVGFVCLYTSFQFALLYPFIVGNPHVFSTVYGFPLKG